MASQTSETNAALLMICACFVFVSGLVSCSAQHQDDSGAAESSSSVAGNPAELAAFQSTVYNFGQTQGCITCHSQYVNPQWMNANLATAYQLARPLLNVDDPTNSIFATYVANGHCGNAICSDPTTIPTMKDALSQWAAVEVNQQSDTNPPSSTGSTLSNPPYVTLTMAIPTPLPLLTSGAPAVIRFDLGQVQPPVADLVGVTLELSIESYNVVGTTYRVFNPRIAGNAASLALNGIHVYVRPTSGSGLGTEDLNQGLLWSDLNVSAPPAALPAPMPTGPMTAIQPLTSISLGIAEQSAADVITVGFQVIQ